MLTPEKFIAQIAALEYPEEMERRGCAREDIEADTIDTLSSLIQQAQTLQHAALRRKAAVS